MYTNEFLFRAIYSYLFIFAVYLFIIFLCSLALYIVRRKSIDYYFKKKNLDIRQKGVRQSEKPDRHKD